MAKDIVYDNPLSQDPPPKRDGRSKLLLEK